MSLALITTGCATGDKESILPQEGPTMKEVYRRHFSGTENGQDELDATRGELLEREAARRKPEQTSELFAYTQDAESEIRQIFPRLMNKTLIMYVFPHLSGAERYPVPGYSTAFPISSNRLPARKPRTRRLCRCAASKSMPRQCSRCW
ncbi:TIGR03751 family conjugal transfer lipoprotein [Methylotuvimicrobium alcaliphilum]|uniref:TIGR03751 family conjugal transfer lipoprotein n=1 Tax=Methylotuvimicrobium alcaliphilum TaxID=271065 RepID=UPI0013923DF8|nr:TIGR03751 family conjugal transfer lipoprotein [Methylotuvimicrobium alcaliphilum]